MATLFEKIISRQIPADIVYEDDLCLAFRDINPQAPHHILIIPKKVISRVAEATPQDEPLLGHLMVVAAGLAKKLNFATEGYRLVMNNGPHGGESVPHMHLHLLGGRQLQWPPG